MRVILKNIKRRSNLQAQTVLIGGPGHSKARNRTLIVAALSVLLLQACEQKIDDTPQPVDQPDDVVDVENGAQLVTLEFLREAIGETRSRAEKGKKPVEPESSDPDSPVKPKERNDDPPKGASHYAVPTEKDLRLVAGGDERLERGKGKTPSDEGDAPPAPPEWRRIGFASGSVDVGAGVDARVLDAKSIVAGRDFTFAMMILNEYLTESLERELEAAGVEVLGAHSTAHKVRLPVDPDAIKEISTLPFIHSISYPEPELKLEIDFREAMEKFAGEIDSLPVLINLFHEFDEETAARFARELRQQDVILGPYDEDLGAYEAVIPMERVKSLINSDFILYIELQTPGGPAHDQSSAVMGVDYIRTGGPGSNFDGSSTIIGILDTGFMVGSAAATRHDDLNKNGCGKNFTSDAAGVWNDENGHGTHVLGTFGGTGTADSSFRGVATGVGNSGSTRIRAAKIWRNTGSNQASWYLDGMNYLAESTSCNSGRPQVINMSGGRTVSNPNGTDARSRKLDAKSFDDKQAYVIAAGNEGAGGAQTLRTPATAKNAITVGNVRDAGFQLIGDIWTSSSLGPTADGRMKPNVVATGRRINSANAGTTSGYTNLTGTSMAAPHVAGISATLLDHYAFLRQKPYLLRAHLMSTAILHDDTTTPRNNSSGGRNTYGLGRVSSYVSHWARSNSNGWNTYLASRTITNSSWGFRDIQVPAGTARLVVVMTWDEDSASSGASKAVKYDLDLWIDRNADCTPDSKGQCGEWASQSYDDNVEYLIVNNPAAGTYRLKIINWDAPRSGLPAGLVATVIRGDPTPAMSMSVRASDLTPSVGDVVTVTTTVSNPSYIASGVFLQRQNLPGGLTYQGVSTTREDGIAMDFTGNGFSLGNIVQGDTRSAVWSFQVNSATSKTLNFRAWSENGGTVTQSITLNPVP